MTLIDLNEAAKRAGFKRSTIDKFIKNGKELTRRKLGNKYVISEDEFDEWMKLKSERLIHLSREDFLEAFTFALKINYEGHTRTDFGTIRQRTFMQAVENWTQGALAEIALRKFLLDKYNTEIEIDLSINIDKIIVAQDITNVIIGKIKRPPKKFVSVKSGKPNGMFLIVSPREVEADVRLSDYYVFVRVDCPVDTFARLYREIPELKELQDKIPELGDISAEIVGYCARNELEKRKVPELQITSDRYVKETGLLKNSDYEWEIFVNEL